MGKYPDVALLCAGTGPDKEMDKLKDLCKNLGLKNTFLIGAKGQDQLAEMYTVANLGCFPSFKEPFGLVFVECMACKTPVIGANSGGPKDFVTPDVGELVQEPKETKDLATVSKGIPMLSKTLNETIVRALEEDWKGKKGDACIKLAHDKFTVATQVQGMLKSVQALPPPCAHVASAESGSRAGQGGFFAFLESLHLQVGCVNAEEFENMAEK